jgi:hypothetical protein
MVFHDFQTQVTQRTVKDYKPHLYITEGLNLMGLCSYPKCAKFEKKVLIRRGFGTWDINKEILNVLCPICKVKIERSHIYTFGMYQSKYVIEGTRKNGEHFMSEGECSNGKLITFEKERLHYFGDFDRWAILKIKAEKL